MLRLLAIVFALGLAAPAGAEDAPASGSVISLADLVREALARNPEVLRGEQRVQAMRARVPQAGALPDPDLMTGVINEGRPVPFETLGTADFSEVYVGISQDLPFPGKRGLREKVARGEASAERWAYEATRRRVIADVVDAYYELHAARAAFETVGRNLELMDRLTRVARERFSVGQGMQQDVLGAEVELSRLEERRSLLEEQQLLLQASVTRLLDRSEPVPLERLAPLARTPLAGTQDEWIARGEQASPRLQEEQARVEAATRRMELARKDRWPDFGVELLYHNRGRGDLDPFYGLGVTVTLPVYASRKQEKAIEEAAAELSAARSAANGARAELRYAVSSAYVRAKTSDRLLRLYDQGLLAQSRLVLDSAIAQYQVGKVDFETVISSWRRLLEDEIAYQQQLAAHEKAFAQLAVQVGSPDWIPPAPLAEDGR